MQYELMFLEALVFTIAVESAALLILMKVFFRKDYLRVGLPGLAFTGFFASFATIPYLWFVLPPFLGYEKALLVGEPLVFIAEAFIINRMLELSMKRAAALSLACNLLSFLLGLLIF